MAEPFSVGSFNITNSTSLVKVQVYKHINHENNGFVCEQCHVHCSHTLCELEVKIALGKSVVTSFAHICEQCYYAGFASSSGMIIDDCLANDPSSDSKLRTPN